MDKFELSISQVDFDGKKVAVVDIYINGRNLIDIAKEVEIPFAKAEGHPDIAGGYMGLPPEGVFYPSKHLLGEPNRRFGYTDKTTVLVCGSCGEGGCWPLEVKITVSEDKVVWSDFGQPHRGPYSKSSHWKYDNLGPFIFDRKQYESELRKKID